MTCQLPCMDQSINENPCAERCASPSSARPTPGPLPSAQNAGAPFDSTVHVLGVCHCSPTNPRAVYEVASAVQPDAFAMEGTEEMQRDMRKAVGSAYLKPLLDKVRGVAG